MELKGQVISLDQAKKLKELGVKEPSLFYWTTAMEEPAVLCQLSDPICSWRYPIDTQDISNPKCFHAYTVAELGEMLPFKFGYDGQESVITTVQYIPNDHIRRWICGIFWTAKPNIQYGTPRKYIPASTEAQARAAMLIYLLTNNLHTL